MASITAWAKKVWKDRKTEYPTRRTLTKTDGSQEIVTVARNEGSVSQEGDAFSAENMNDLEERIDAGFTEVNGKLISYETFSININVTLTAKQQIYITKLSPHIPNGKSIVGFAGFADASYIILTFGTNTAFGLNTVRGYNPQDVAIGITQLNCVLFYA